MGAPCHGDSVAARRVGEVAARSSLMGIDTQKKKYPGRLSQREMLTEGWVVGSSPDVNQLSHLLNKHWWQRMHSVIRSHFLSAVGRGASPFQTDPSGSGKGAL